MQHSPFVSVIIPTFNRAHMLPLTLESFLSQDYPQDRYEVIVADNNSSDTTREVTARYANTTVPVKYLFEKRQGVHYARNSAAKTAIGEILYFTDDDMLADKDLLTNLVKVFFMDYNVGVATGRVVPEWETEPPKWILKYCNNYLLSLNDRVEQMIITPFDMGVFSCHQAILKEAFFKSGGFNPENTAGEWIGDGETGLNIKIKELGYNFAYVGDSVIHHMIPPSRMTQKYLNKRMANQGNCHSYTYYRKHKHNNVHLVLQIVKHSVNIFALLAGFIPCLIFSRDSWHLLVSRLYYNINRIKYDMRLIYDKDWRNLVLKYNWIED